MLHWCLGAALLILVAGPPRAAAAQAVTADSITAQAIAHHIDVIANDSMQGRDTPSPGLDLTARYVASQFDQAGLRPGSRSGTWFQRYQIPLRLAFDRSRIVFTTGGKRVEASFATAAHLASPYLAAQVEPADVIVISGVYSRESARGVSDKIRGHTVIYISPTDVDSATRRQSISSMFRASEAKGFLIVSDEDSAAFARQVQMAMHDSTVQRPLSPSLPQWSAYIRPAGVQGLTDLLTAAGLDLNQARADRAPRLRALPSLGISLEAEILGWEHDTATAPNVIGLLEGRDPELKKQYVVFSAHMDARDVPGEQPGSLRQGANDNASGIAGLIELAKAFSRRDAQPRRSLLFLATSGGATGLWGSYEFVARPSVWKTRIVADLDLDMIGSGASDTVLVDGLREVNLAMPVLWTAASHPELRLTVGNGGTAFQPRSDHFPFALAAFPSLSFRNSLPKDDTSLTPTPAGAERAARFTRFVFYVGQTVANADARPALTGEGRRNWRQACQRYGCGQ